MLKKITRIEIKNYQSHRHTLLDMDSPVVVLSGESDNGKTVIIRALQWIATNRPMGDGFVSHWQMHQTKSGKVALNSDAECSVMVTALDDHGEEHLIKRVKTATENYYVVDGTKLSAIGSGVPSEVTSLLCFHDENIQDQDEKYYLLTLTGSQVSSKLNELVNLDSIDDAYAVLKRQKLDEGAMHKMYETQYYEHKVAVDGLKHIPDLMDVLAEVKDIEAKIAQTEDEIENINDMLCQLRKINTKLHSLRMLSTYEKSMERVKELLGHIDSHRESIDAIEELANKAYRVGRRLARLPKVDEKSIQKLDGYVGRYEGKNAEYLTLHAKVKKWKELENRIVTLPEEDFGRLQKMLGEYEVMKGATSAVWKLFGKIQEVMVQQAENVYELEECQAQLPEVCPLCGQPMEGHIHV